MSEEQDQQRRDQVARARERFGRPFAYEPGTDWRPHTERVLSQWLAQRLSEKQGKTA